MQKTKETLKSVKATNDLLTDRILNCGLKTCEIAVFLKSVLKSLPKTLINIKQFSNGEPLRKFPPIKKQ